MRWLCACGLALLLTGYFGGFSLSAGAVFLAIFAVGAVLLGLDEPEVAEPDHDYDLGDDDSGVELADEPEEPVGDADEPEEPVGDADEPEEPVDAGREAEALPGSGCTDESEIPEPSESPELPEPPESPELPESPGTPVAT